MGFRRLLGQVLAPFAVAGALIAGVSVVAAQPAFANNGVELCNYSVNAQGIAVPNSPCADAYGNGGSLIKSYSPGATWEYIVEQPTGDGVHVQLYDVNTNGCLGAANNDPNDARIADNLRCPSWGNAGWATIFLPGSQDFCGAGGKQYYNSHDLGIMQGGVPGGSQWYGNVQNASKSACLKPFGS